MDRSSLQQFIKHFRALLAIIMLCIVTISSFIALTLSKENEAATEINKLENILTTLLASVGSSPIPVNQTA